MTDSTTSPGARSGSGEFAAGSPSLSVIIPVFNGAGWIGRSLGHLLAAIDVSGFAAAEVLLVDDGSTDGTVVEAMAAFEGRTNVPLRLLSQPNSGRFAARRLGLEHAVHPFVLFIDTRVFMDHGALAFLAPRLADESQQVWTSHVVAATENNPIAGFWQAIEHMAWRRYFKNPRTMSYRIDEFDYYPKGTTALVAPRDLLLEAFESFDPTVADWHKVNDDTAVLRFVAERCPINISPAYSSVYNARTTLPEFVRHAEHRGTVLIDGYLRRGTRFAIPIVVVLLLTPVAVWFAVRHPIKFVILALTGSLSSALGARALGARPADARVLARYSVPFGIAYLIGMWRGTRLRILALLQKGSDRP